MSIGKSVISQVRNLQKVLRAYKSIHQHLHEHSIYIQDKKNHDSSGHQSSIK